MKLNPENMAGIDRIEIIRSSIITVYGKKVPMYYGYFCSEDTLHCTHLSIDLCEDACPEDPVGYFVASSLETIKARIKANG